MKFDELIPLLKKGKIGLRNGKYYKWDYSINQVVEYDDYSSRVVNESKVDDFYYIT